MTLVHLIDAFFFLIISPTPAFSLTTQPPQLKWTSRKREKPGELFNHIMHTPNFADNDFSLLLRQQWLPTFEWDSPRKWEKVPKFEIVYLINVPINVLKI